MIFIAVSLLLSVKILIFLPLRLEATELLDLELSLEAVPLSSAEAPTLKPQVTQLEDAADPWEMRAAVLEATLAVARAIFDRIRREHL